MGAFHSVWGWTGLVVFRGLGTLALLAALAWTTLRGTARPGGRACLRPRCASPWPWRSRTAPSCSHSSRFLSSPSCGAVASADGPVAAVVAARARRRPLRQCARPLGHRAQRCSAWPCSAGGWTMACAIRPPSAGWSLRLQARRPGRSARWAPPMSPRSSPSAMPPALINEWQPTDATVRPGLDLRGPRGPGGGRLGARPAFAPARAARSSPSLRCAMFAVDGVSQPGPSRAAAGPDRRPPMRRRLGPEARYRPGPARRGCSPPWQR